MKCADKDRSYYDPDYSRQPAESGGRYKRTYYRPGAGDRGEMMAEQNIFIAGNIVHPVSHCSRRNGLVRGNVVKLFKEIPVKAVACPEKNQHNNSV